MKEIPRYVIDSLSSELDVYIEFSAESVRNALLNAIDEMGKLDAEIFTQAEIELLRDVAVETANYSVLAVLDNITALTTDYFDAINGTTLSRSSNQLKYAESDMIRELRRDIGGATGDVFDGEKSIAQFVQRCCEIAGGSVNRAHLRTLDNCARKSNKKLKWARIPSGAETCPFCVMLSSRGFVYRSAQTAGAHYHSHCDCRISSEMVDGYNPKGLLNKYFEMLQGHELESTYDLQTRNGKTTSKLYKTASYDYKSALGAGGKSGRNYKYYASNDELTIESFSDLKNLICSAKNEDDLTEIHKKLVRLYGEDSEQISSASVENAFKHQKKNF